MADNTEKATLYRYDKESDKYVLYHPETEVSQIVDFSSGVKDSVLTKEIKSALLQKILPDSAASHNSIYRGKDLTAYWNSGEMSKAIKAGTFDDIFPGDYVTKSITVNGTTYNVKWIVGDLDYHLAAAAGGAAWMVELRCPVCAGALAKRAGAYVCPKNHSFDLARSGKNDFF